MNRNQHCNTRLKLSGKINSENVMFISSELVYILTGENTGNIKWLSGLLCLSI